MNASYSEILPKNAILICYAINKIIFSKNKPLKKG